MAVLNQNLNSAFDLFELKPANEISFLDSYKKTLSKCCVDPLRPPDLSGVGAYCHSPARQKLRLESLHNSALIDSRSF